MILLYFILFTEKWENESEQAHVLPIPKWPGRSRIKSMVWIKYRTTYSVISGNLLWYRVMLEEVHSPCASTRVPSCLLFSLGLHALKATWRTSCILEKRIQMATECRSWSGHMHFTLNLPHPYSLFIQIVSGPQRMVHAFQDKTCKCPISNLLP